MLFKNLIIFIVENEQIIKNIVVIYEICWRISMNNRILCCLISLSLCTIAYGACPHQNAHISNCRHNHNIHSTHHTNHGTSSDNQVYLVNQEYSKTEKKFPNCSKHYMIAETTIYHYSDGSRRSFSNYTVYNSDGTVLMENCKDVKHILYNNSHYFIISKNGYYLTDDKGNKITQKTYSNIREFKPNRLIVKRDKKYGIIDLKENIIVPAKYQKFNAEGNIFITKLNGYWGILDSENNIHVKNECEKIKPFCDVILLKKYGKYGLADLKGNIIYDVKYNKIKKLGEYILVRENQKYFVLNSEGKRINDSLYKKIKLKRNTLYGLNDNKNWTEIQD